MANAVEIKFAVEGVEEVSAMFEVGSKRAGSLQPPLKKASDLMIKVIDVNFASHGREFGEPWKKRKKAYGWPLLEKTGQLRKSFDYKLSSQESVIGNKKEYFGYHQSNRPRKKMPRRIMMKIDETRRQLIVKIFQEYIMKG